MAEDRGLRTRERLLLGFASIMAAGLFSLAFGWICDRAFGHEAWTGFVLANFGLVIGMPMAAALAFAIVLVFQEVSAGPLALRLGPLEISGPAGPILLWVVCFVAIVFAIGFLGSGAAPPAAAA